eukprot:scaffold2952_cov312-Pinguiococcus_pyrenoidosus.AAC.6
MPSAIECASCRRLHPAASAGTRTAPRAPNPYVDAVRRDSRCSSSLEIVADRCWPPTARTAARRPDRQATRPAGSPFAAPAGNQWSNC